LPGQDGKEIAAQSVQRYSNVIHPLWSYHMIARVAQNAIFAVSVS
jgi:hypothetical protein